MGRETKGLLVTALLLLAAVGCTSTNTEKISDDKDRAASRSAKSLAETAGAAETSGAARTTATAETLPPTEATAVAEGLAWDAPDVFRPVVPSSAMRIVQYDLPASDEGLRPAELALFFFGSGVGGRAPANLDRWIEQFRQPDRSDSRQKALVDSFTTAGGLKVTTVRLSGIYKPQTMDDKPTFDFAGWALYGAVIEGKGGPWFFKAVGPEAVIEGHRESLDRLYRGVRLAS